MSAAVVHRALVQYVLMLGEQVSAPGTTQGPHPLHRTLVADATSPVVEHSLRAQSAFMAGVHPVVGATGLTGVMTPPTHGPHPRHWGLAMSAAVVHLALAQ